MVFNGLGMHLGNLARVSAAETRSISAENFTCAKGQGGMAEDGAGAAAVSRPSRVLVEDRAMIFGGPVSTRLLWW